MLVVAFAVFWAHSAFGPVTVGKISLKQSKLAQAIIPDSTAQAEHEIEPNIDPDRPVQLVEVPDTVAVDTASKVILFIGDSMLEGLGPRMAAYADANGHTLYNVMWYSSQTQAWGQSGKIAKYVKQLNPDYIFICLGTNELFVKDIREKREKYVQQMVREIGDIPFVWIGPPNWKPDTGINAMIRDNVPPGSYFKSDGMQFERSKDGAHPTRSSAALWLDSVARWMPAHAAHPIRMDLPQAKSGRPKKIFVHQPSEIP